MQNTKPSIFMQMHNGTRTGEGSFNVGLRDLFYAAGQANRRKLVNAFPEFFGDEVPEFGITDPDADKKSLRYKGWLIKWNNDEQLYFLFTPEEMEQPAGFRSHETEVSMMVQAKRFIDNY